MFSSILGDLLEEFGTLLHIKIVPDENNTCVIKTKSGLRVQLEVDRSGQNLLIVSKLPELPPSGGYRENIFREALKANGMPPPRHGTFAFSKKSNSLVIFTLLNLKNLNGDKILAAFTPLLAKAQSWQDAISRGEVPTVSENTAKSSAGFFGGLR